MNTLLWPQLSAREETDTGSVCQKESCSSCQLPRDYSGNNILASKGGLDVMATGKGHGELIDRGATSHLLSPTPVSPGDMKPRLGKLPGYPTSPPQASCATSSSSWWGGGLSRTILSSHSSLGHQAEDLRPPMLA